MVRVHTDVTMPRKMLGRRHDAGILHAPHVLQSILCHDLFVFTKRPVVDDRIGGIVIDIHHRCIIDMDAQATALLSHPATVAIDQVRVTHRTEHHLTRKSRDTVQPHAHTVLSVDGHQDGRAGDRLEMIDQ